ncbi:TolC family outer membrane protein [Psychromonas sp. Urea-02u-13]|uniref:TolC family outer membrane protein n=1 Tax=Psychromonas sp. Urea-02u-13 TaxID=2058326 RepID=UPI000C33E784|nr:TolC family outer membrane protein [Psychromonas sp. Urea-02u-13]PKG39333.1 channel protein TolC [Psychromonas sp. Urea-02u-13]
MKKTYFKLIKKTVLGLLCSAIFLPTAVNSQSLEQAVAFTFDTHPELRAAYTRFKVTEKQVEQAEAGYWPTIDATAGIGYEYTDSPGTRRTGLAGGDDTEELPRREVGLSLKQELFSGFHTSSEVDRTSYATSAEQWRLYSIAEDLALEVSKVYIDLIKAEKLVSLSEKNLEAHQEIYEQIKIRTDSGFGSSADLSQINGRLAKAHSNLIAAKNNFLDSKVTFYRVIEQRPDNLVIPYPDGALLPKTKEEGLASALINHPVIKSATNDIQSARAQHDTAKSSYYPKVSFDVNANFNDNLDGEDGKANGSDVGGENNEVIAMIRVSYNIFSGGRDDAYAKETAYKMSEAKELNRNVHRQVTEGFILSWNAFEQLNLQKKYIKMHVIASKDTQSDYTEQFKIGQRSLLDLLDTENELYQARRDFLDAEFTEISAQYRILHSIGLLVDSLRVTRPESWLGEEQFDGGVRQ